MNSQLVGEVLRLGGNPADPVWHWLLLRGPHGSSFTWSQSRREPAGYVGLELLRRVIQEHEAVDEQFGQNALAVARCALASTDPVTVRRGIQVIGAIGGKDEIAAISELSDCPDIAIRADAKACLFELKQKARRLAT